MTTPYGKKMGKEETRHLGAPADDDDDDDWTLYDVTPLKPR